MPRPAAAPDQPDLFAPEPPSVPRCLYRSAARGAAARTAEFGAWRAAYGTCGSLAESHAWTITFTAPSDPTARCQPTVLWADLRPTGTPAAPAPPCGCWDVGAMLYRGACTGCPWEGPPRTDENPAAEDACDHAHPGWRDLPTVPRPPRYGTSKAARAELAAWLAGVRAVYPAGWLEAGGPIRTARDPQGSRHVEKATPFGGYDLAVIHTAEAAPSATSPQRCSPRRRPAEVPTTRPPPSALPVLARVFPPGCRLPGCQHHYWRPPEGCICVTWPADRGGAHVFAANALCPAHHTVVDIIEDAADVLCMRDDYLDPEADEIPADVFYELAELWRAGPCGLCPRWGNPDALADHFLARKQEEWERSLPAWACDCGAMYKRLTEWGEEHFYKTTGDYGRLDDLAGSIRRNAKGQVKRSDPCPACGRRFADTIARQTDPQQPLF